MGLDVTAYRKLFLAPDAPVDEDGWPENWDMHWRASPALIEETEGHWPGRTEGLAAGVHTFGEMFDFRAGSYGGYNGWRDDLARLAGHGDAYRVWEGITEGPFVELINFSDCEGLIGPTVAAKLAKDFADHQAKADTFGDDWFRQKYADWRKAFEMAADGGAVSFH